MAENMVNIDNYKENRQKFLQELKVGEIQTINVKRESEKKQQERYRVKKAYREYQKKQARKKAKLIRNVALTAGLAGLMVFGGVKSYSNYQEKQNTITLEQALENGETPESLGLTEDTIAQMQELNEMLEGNITNQELIVLAEKLPTVQMNVMKDKLADTFEIEQNDISLNASDPKKETITSVSIGKAYYGSNTRAKENTISDDIKNYIEDIADAQEIRDNIDTADIDRSKMLKTVKKLLEETNKFAAGKIEVDEKGNIDIEKVKVSELEKQQTEEGYEIGD